MEVRDGSGNPRRSLTVWETLPEVRDGSGDPRGGLGLVR